MPEELASACAGNGMAAMALLDRDGVYGAPRFYHAAARNFDSRAHRRGSDVSDARWRYPLLVEIARGISESLPLDHADEIARGERTKATFAARSC